MRYRVVEWQKYQHYKDRNPPWIKLHFALLSSRTWVMLDDASRVLAIACMLLASRDNGEISCDAKYIKRVAYLNHTPNFKPLIECGFLEMLADASDLLADASNSLSVSSSLTSESSSEKSKKDARASKRCPPEFVVTDEMRAWAVRKCRPGINIEAVTEAFRDHTFAVARSDWPATWRNWMRREKPTQANGNGQLTKYEQTMQTLAKWNPDDERDTDQAALDPALSNLRTAIR